MNHITPYLAAIFDLDGTLVDSTQAIVTSTFAAIDELGWQPVPEAVIAAHIGYKLEAIFPEKSKDQRRELIDTIGRHYDGICAQQTVLHPGIGELLRHLKKHRLPMAVVTSKRRRHTETILAALGIREDFAVVIGSDDVSHMKPDPEGLKAAMASLGMVADACLYVGDTRIDVETAQGAKMAVAGVAWGTDGAKKLAKYGAGHDAGQPPFHPIDHPAALYPLFGAELPSSE